MTDPIEILMSEHRLIEQVLDALESYVSQLDGPASEQRDLGDFVTVLRRFADAYHHGKEEDILFAAMVERGFPRDGGPIAVMLMEHTEGRRLVGQLEQAARATAAWSPDDRRAIAEDARTFALLLRNHIVKEDSILYPMSQAHLPEEAWQRMAGDFERFAARHAEEHARLQAIAGRLLSRFAPAAEPQSAPRAQPRCPACDF